MPVAAPPLAVALPVSARRRRLRVEFKFYYSDSLPEAHTKARVVTVPVRGLHYGPTVGVVTLDLQEPLPKYILVLTLEY